MIAMKALRENLLTPISISVAVGHWIAVLYAYFGEHHTEPFHFIYESLFSQVLIVLNLLPLIIAGILGPAILGLLGFGRPAAELFLWAVFFLIASLQWLFVGYMIEKLLAVFKPGETQFTINE